MDDLSKIQFPTVDIEAHVRRLRNMQPATDPAVLAKATVRGKAVAPAYIETAHAIADMIDVYRINGYSAGEAVQVIWEMFLDPIASVPVIATTE